MEIKCIPFDTEKAFGIEVNEELKYVMLVCSDKEYIMCQVL